ncbi:MAG: DHH family phosphoesterase [Burkholderiales bacterium]
MPRYIDVFNGDADGLCALQQLRLAEPVDAELITGCKRDIALLSRVQANAGTIVTVLDISLQRNRAALEALLAAQVRVRYFDHHFAGDIPRSPWLEAHIDTAADACTSVIVDRSLNGRFRPWAIVAAYGDNVIATAERLADASALDPARRATLRTLGESLNYNAYGEKIEDLHIHPAALYRRLSSFDSPFELAAREPIVQELTALRAADLANALNIAPLADHTGYTIHRLPNEPWSRRVLGSFAHHLASTDPMRAHAVLAPNRDGTVSASVRVDAGSPVTAHAVCLPFSGGGRQSAAGIDRLSPADADVFVAAFGAIRWR